jgi:hypothetical protein
MSERTGDDGDLAREIWYVIYHPGGVCPVWACGGKDCCKIERKAPILTRKREKEGDKKWKQAEAVL